MTTSYFKAIPGRPGWFRAQIGPFLMDVDGRAFGRGARRRLARNKARSEARWARLEAAYLARTLTPKAQRRAARRLDTSVPELMASLYGTTRTS